ncbi:MAG: 6-bladed beta-propeller, partial [Phycisphaerales bacterium]|nr:6-bladed beta-propeller [Phycisphaerales bacterium]
MFRQPSHRCSTVPAATFLTLAACLFAGGLGLAGCAATPEAKTSAKAAPQGMYAFWPKYPDEPRIQFVRSISVSTDVAPSQASGLEKLVFGKENVNDVAAVYKPYGVDCRGGKIYVCDIRSACVTVFDIAKKQTRLVGVSGVNRLAHPVDVAVADDGMIYVADNEQGSVLVFDASERYLRPIGKSKAKPVSVAVHGEKLYVCDMAAQVVEVFNRKDGTPIGTIGSVGDGDGQFRLPLCVDVDKAGNIYVVDMMRCRIQKFSPEGQYISGLGQMGDYAGAFVRPKHMAVDSDGILYVVDAAFQNVQMFDDQARLLMHFGAAGTFPGSMDMPVGVCVTDEGV